MARIIRRTLIITIHERWTFVCSGDQTNDTVVTDEAAPLPSPVAIVEQLCHLLGLPAPTAQPADNSVQLSIHYPDKESTDEDTDV